MKKNLMISAALVFAALASCTKEAPVTPVEPEESFYELTVALPENNEAKTVIAPDGGIYRIFWQNGDKVSAGTSNISDPLSGITEETTQVVFTFSKAVSADDFVRCPAVAEPQSVTIPASQTSAGGQYDINANPMWGSVEPVESAKAIVKLNTAMAMIKLSVKGTATLAGAQVTAVGGQPLHGKFNMASDGKISGGTETGNVNNVNFDGGLQLSATAQDIYIPVLPANYDKGLSVRLMEADGKYLTANIFKSGVTLSNKTIAIFEFNYAPSTEPVDLNALAVLGAVDAVYNDSKPAGSIRVGSYNVWSDLDRAGQVGGQTDKYQYRTWDYARDAVASVIVSMDCDVVCFNEITGNTLKADGSASLQAAIAGYTNAYTYSLDWPNEVDKDHWYSSTEPDFTYANGFIYKSSALTLNASGMFWLNPDGKTGWDNEANDKDAGGKRTCVWAKFTQNSTGKVVYVATAQLPTGSQGSEEGAQAGYWNLQTAKNLIANLCARTDAAETDPIILCGDMNASKTTLNQGFNYIVNASEGNPNTTLVFTDARDYLSSEGKLNSSETGFPGTSVSTWNIANYLKSEKHRLDHIMFRNCNVSNYKSYRKTYSVDADSSDSFWYPSNHIPVSVDVAL